MSLEYYLFTKKKYEEILFHLDEIIEIQQQLNVKEFRDPIFELEKNTHFFIEQKNQVEQYIRLCSRRICTLCEHEFTEDYIDITPEHSEKIKYCIFCEYTL